jgi:hypothetical protein
LLYCAGVNSFGENGNGSTVVSSSNIRPIEVAGQR